MTSDPDHAGQATSATQRLRRWTVNLVLTSLILVTGISFARHARVWFRKPAAEFRLTDPGPTGLATSAQIQLGQSPFMFRRQVVSGDATIARRRLVELCQLEAAATRLRAPAAPPGPDERRLLDRLATMTAVGQGHGWRLYEQDGPLPMACAVHVAQAPEDWRILCWGLALPATESSDSRAAIEEWTLFIVNTAVGDDTRSAGHLIRLPPGSETTLELSGQRGSSIVTFTGTGLLDNWKRFFAGEVQRLGAAGQPGWQQNGGSFSRRFEVKDQTIEIQIHGTGNLTGVLIVTQSG